MSIFQLKGLRLIVAIAGITFGFQASADSDEVLALKAYADFKMGLYQSAFQQFEYLASIDNTQGLLNLAIMLDEGLGCEPDSERSTDLLHRASELGSVNAMERLASRYRHGDVEKNNHKKAIQLYEKAAAAGSSEAMYQLFIMHLDSQPEISRDWLALAQKEGHIAALKVDSLTATFEIPIEQQLSARDALDSIDRSANNRFAEGVTYFINPKANISIRTRGLTQTLSKSDLKFLWQSSFDRGPEYQFKRSNITMRPIDDTRIEIASQITESFDRKKTEILEIRETLTVSFANSTFEVESIQMQID